MGPSIAADVLFVAAFAPELAALEPWLGTAMEACIGDVRVVGRAVGVGLAAAAAGAALHIDRRRARAVILLGTCGAYAGTNLALDDVVVSRTVRLVEPAALLGSVQFPGSMPTRIESDGGLSSALERCGAQPADVATTVGITVDDAVGELIARVSGVRVEHLEAFGVATASTTAQVPFAALLGVANMVGSRGREQWRQHHRDAAARAVERAVRWIRDGAEGLPAGHR